MLSAQRHTGFPSKPDRRPSMLPLARRALLACALLVLPARRVEVFVSLLRPLAEAPTTTEVTAGISLAAAGLKAQVRWLRCWSEVVAAAYAATAAAAKLAAASAAEFAIALAAPRVAAPEAARRAAARRAVVLRTRQERRRREGGRPFLLLRGVALRAHELLPELSGLLLGGRGSRLGIRDLRCCPLRRELGRFLLVLCSRVGWSFGRARRAAAACRTAAVLAIHQPLGRRVV
mmetsp:Transcript_65465/g.184882  ORF Transcript_65465/g.184882 Transcript_65465/m.184882 type:complete len:233 (-) Transcript_65465:1132-1830(-)